MKTRIALLLLCLVSYSVESQAQHGTSHAAAKTLTCPQIIKITIKNFKYNDGNPVTVRPGDSIVWFNADDMPHTATSTDESAQSFDTGILQPGQASDPIVFLQASGAEGFPYSCGVHPRMSGAVIVSPGQEPVSETSGCNHHETPSEHSMVVSGLDPQSIFLHHISLFGDTNHFYHVTLEVRLEDPAAQEAYRTYRKENGDSLCILDPELFLLPEIESGKRTSFFATFNHGNWDSKIKGLEHVKVVISRKIQFRRYDPKDTYPDRLSYQLFGNDKEIFLAHQVTAAPSFQQVVKLKEVPPFLTAAVISSNPLLTITSKQLSDGGSRVLKTATLSNGTHILLSPPPNTLKPRMPLQENEEIEVQFAGSTETHKLVVGKLIYFDVRILNK